jgi:L-lysine exporter family protein LysE/ArgO
MKEHVFVTCLICSISDAFLIGVGVFGFGTFLSSINKIAMWMSIMASIFLTTYGIIRIKSSLNPESIKIEGEGTKGAKSTIFSALAFTFLNPHVYLDTLLLIGGTSSRYLDYEKVAFGVGAAFASFLFFFSLGYGARFMSPILNNPKSWQIIDLSIAAIMFTVSFFIISPYLF